MLQRLSGHIVECFERVTAAEYKADTAVTSIGREEFRAIAKNWRMLAESYLFVQSLERFLLDSDRQKSPPEPPATGVGG